MVTYNMQYDFAYYIVVGMLIWAHFCCFLIYYKNICERNNQVVLFFSLQKRSIIRGWKSDILIMLISSFNNAFKFIKMLEN